MERLLAVRAEDFGKTASPPSDELVRLEETRLKDLLDMAEQENAEWLDKENDKLDAYRGESLGGRDQGRKKALRGSAPPMAEKLAEKRRIGTLEAKQCVASA